MEKYQGFFICFVFFTGLINIGQACNGYKLAIKKIENCAGPEGVLKVYPNATASFSKDCKIVLGGCGETNDFQTAQVKYTISKNGNRVFSGSTDACEEMKKDSKGIGTALMSFGLPNQCPVQKLTKCADGEQIDISKQKNLLSLARGTINVHIDVDHDSGKSCIDLVVEISK